MKIFRVDKDGGKESSVWAFWLCEIKSLFSIAFLLFKGDSREAYHTHAFNSISWVIKGQLTEEMLDGTTYTHKPSIKPVMTYRNTFHKVSSKGNTYVFTLRGSWVSKWKEYLPDENRFITLTHGRVVTDD